MEDPTTVSGYHLFLQPSVRHEEIIKTVMREVAQVIETPLFMPHVTILVVRDSMAEDVLSNVADIVSRRTTPIQVALGEICMEETFFRSLYVDLMHSTEIHALRERVLEVAALPKLASISSSTALFHPHMSIAYTHASEQERTRAASHVASLVGTEILFDRLTVVRTEGTADQWEQVSTHYLSGAGLV